MNLVSVEAAVNRPETGSADAKKHKDDCVLAVHGDGGAGGPGDETAGEIQEWVSAGGCASLDGGV